MGSTKRTDSDLTSVSSGLSTAPDESTTANGSVSKTTKPKSSKTAAVKKTKAQTASASSTSKKAATSKNGTGKDSGRPAKEMTKPKANGKGKGKAVVEEIEKVEKRQRTYGLLPQDMIDYAEDDDIKSEYVGMRMVKLHSRYADVQSSNAAGRSHTFGLSSSSSAKNLSRDYVWWMSKCRFGFMLEEGKERGGIGDHPTQKLSGFVRRVLPIATDALKADIIGFSPLAWRKG